MERTITRTQAGWLIAAVLLCSSAGYTLIGGSEGLLSVTFPVGVSMLFAGLINMWVYHINHHKLHGSHWLFADGMSTALLSVFLLFNHSVSAPVIPFFLGVWELLSGVLKFMDATDMREDHIHGRLSFFAVGMLELISGVASLLKPIEDNQHMHVTVATILLIQSAGVVCKIFLYPQLCITHDR
ncbi:MAG: DUF308 domain-containing protein [Clostridia bacterium]|nr:DUF308 domain-containing protein [Clostridia bacterium]